MITNIDNSTAGIELDHSSFLELTKHTPCVPLVGGTMGRLLWIFRWKFALLWYDYTIFPWKLNILTSTVQQPVIHTPYFVKIIMPLNSFVTERCACNLGLVIFKIKSRLYIWSISFKIIPRWMPPGGRFKNTFELLNLRALKFSLVNKIHIFQCMGKIFCVEFQRYPLKLHTKYLTHTLKNKIFIQHWNFKSS